MCIKRYKFTLIFLSICIVFAFVIYSKARINASYFVFLPGYKPNVGIEQIDDEELKSFFRIVQKFNDGSQFVIVLHNPNGFFSPNALFRVIELQNELTKLSCIKSVLGITNYTFKKPYFDGSALDEGILEDPEARSFISKDGRYLLFHCTLARNCDEDKALQDVRRLLKDFQDLQGLLFGQIVINRELFREIINQVFVYPAIIFLVILSIFYLQTRSLKASLVSLMVPVLANLIVYGTTTLLGMELNTMTVMCVSFLIVIGSAYGLHFYNGIVRFADGVLREMFRPIFFSMLTTAVGFLSFLFVEITAFRQLGLMVSFGLALVFIILFTSGYELLRNEKKVQRKTILFKIESEKVGRTLFVSSLILIVLTFVLLPKIDVGMDQASYFSKNSQIGRALKILTQEFSYREPVYIMVEKDTLFNIKDSENIKSLLKDLSEIEGISSAQFPMTYPVPTLVMLSRFQPVINHFVADGKTIRIVLNITEEAYRKAGRLKHELLEIVQKYSDYSFTIASAAFVVDRINSRVVKSQIQSLTLSLLLILSSVLFAFRDLSLSFTIVVPVIFTALMNFFFMAVLNLRLDVATSIVASILVGLVVDYSIHLAHDMRRTKDVFVSIENVSMPILTNGLGLIAGFLVLIFSKLALFRSISLLLILGIGFGVSFTLFSQPLLIKRSIGNVSTKRK